MILLAEAWFNCERVYYVTKGGIIAVAPMPSTEVNCVFKPLIEIVPLLLNPIADNINDPPL